MFWQSPNLVKYVCEFLPRMKARHPLYTYLKLRCACRQVLQVTHVQMQAACNAMLFILGKEKEYMEKELARVRKDRPVCGDRENSTQRLVERIRLRYESVKKVKDSGFFCQTLLPGENSERSRPRVHEREASLIMDRRTGMPKAMTPAYKEARMQIIGSFGWFEGKFFL